MDSMFENNRRISHEHTSQLTLIAGHNFSVSCLIAVFDYFYRDRLKLLPCFLTRACRNFIIHLTIVSILLDSALSSVGASRACFTCLVLSRRPRDLAASRLASRGITDNADESGWSPCSRGSDIGQRCSRCYANSTEALHNSVTKCFKIFRRASIKKIQISLQIKNRTDLSAGE